MLTVFGDGGGGFGNAYGSGYGFSGGDGYGFGIGDLDSGNWGCGGWGCGHGDILGDGSGGDSDRYGDGFGDGQGGGSGYAFGRVRDYEENNLLDLRSAMLAAQVIASFHRLVAKESRLCQQTSKK